jgi:hypothetical protein
LIGFENPDGDTLARRRSAVRLSLLPTDRLNGETAAFDVLIDGVYAGHWIETTGGRAAVTWVRNGECVETKPCDGDEAKVIATIQPTIPASSLELATDLALPNYNVKIVETVILEIAAELHPKHLSTGELLRKIAHDPGDEREIDTGVLAIRNLREVGVLAQRDDEIVELTPPAFRAAERLLPEHPCYGTRNAR